MSFGTKLKELLNPKFDPVEEFIEKKMELGMKCLDLTDPKNQKILGVTIEELIQDPLTNPEAFDVTHRIGEVARNAGFEAIQYYGSLHSKEVHICILVREQELFEEIDNRASNQRFTPGGPYGSAGLYLNRQSMKRIDG